MAFSTAVMNSLMDMYFKNGGELYALKVFDRLQDSDIISWNTVFSGLSQLQGEMLEKLEDSSIN